MKYDNDLKDTEQRVYLLFHKDGFLDIAVGLCVLIAGLVVANDLAFLWIIFALIDIIAWRTAKKYVTLPRIGQTSYSKDRKGKNSVLIGLAFFSFMSFIAVGVMLFFFYGGQDAEASFGLLFLNEFQMVIGIFTILLLGFSAFILGLNRFLIYGFLSIAALLINQLTDISLWSTYIYLGSVITIIGIGLLIRFLQNYRLIDTMVLEDEIGGPKVE